MHWIREIANLKFSESVVEDNGERRAIVRVCIVYRGIWISSIGKSGYPLAIIAVESGLRTDIHGYILGKKLTLT